MARELAQLGANLRVVMTPSAMRFVGRQTFAAVSGNPVGTEIFGVGADVTHVELARGAALAIVAPATANALAKMAAGLADDLLSATLLMVTCPVMVAPAMHAEMWQHPATVANVETLSRRGVEVMGPAEGRLISGDEGVGRMVEPAAIVARAVAWFKREGDLQGKSVLITAGGTQEPIDPVRFIGNRSSGLMGFEIAREALERGAKVTLVAGPTTLPPPRGADLVAVTTADEMRDAVLARAPDADVIIKAAAVADFKPARASDRKLKKAHGPPVVELVPTPDILADLGRSPESRKGGSLLVGFAAETEPDPHRLGELASEKRRAKDADVIVANDVASADSGFGARTNRAVIAGPDGIVDLGLVTKSGLAAALLDAIALLQARPK